ncbi:GlcNAc-binding protein A precursor [Acinetobacter baumannii]|nr:GlcNAc-binding protein A precursor [Acinetobacter baumannii]
MKPGPQTFTWYHTAKHKTNNWRYYITKQDWDVNKPLSREAFEKEPFCEVDGHAQAPKDREVHQCVVPERTGYQVIYGVWEINDTVNRWLTSTLRMTASCPNGASSCKALSPAKTCRLATR